MAARKTAKKTRKKAYRAIEVESVQETPFVEVAPAPKDPVDEIYEQMEAIDQAIGPARERLRELERNRESLDSRLLQIRREKNIQRWEKLWGFLRDNPDLLDVLVPEHRPGLCRNDVYNSGDVGDSLCPRCTLEALGREYCSDDLADFVLNLYVVNE